MVTSAVGAASSETWKVAVPPLSSQADMIVFDYDLDLFLDLAYFDSDTLYIRRSPWGGGTSSRRAASAASAPGRSPGRCGSGDPGRCIAGRRSCATKMFASGSKSSFEGGVTIRVPM